MKGTCSDYEKNVFIQNLLCNVAYPFEVKDVERVVAQYHLGTVKNGYRAGAVTFPFIDVNNNIRTIQVKQFDKSNHTTSIDFLHSILEKQYKRKSQPLPNTQLVKRLFKERYKGFLLGCLGLGVGGAFATTISNTQTPTILLCW